MLIFSLQRTRKYHLAGRWPGTLVVLCLLFLAACEQAQAPTPTPTAKALPNLTILDTGPLIIGRAIAVQGDHFPHEAAITFSLDQHPLADSDQRPLVARSDTTGTFAVILHLLPTWSPGAHLLTASAGTQTASITLTLVAPTPTPTPPPDATATPPPIVGQLYVAPLSTTTDCGTPRGLFQISDTGTGILAWQLSYDTSSFTITPTQAVMDPGQALILVVTKRTAGKDSITITSNVGAVTVEVEC